MKHEELVAKEKDLSHAYMVAFDGNQGGTVLRDLTQFCGKDHICFHEDPRQEAFLLGARSVILYIMDKINGESVRRLEGSMRQSQ
jgi:hypothetical protein